MKVRPTTIVLVTLLVVLAVSYPALNRFSKKWFVAHSEAFTPIQLLKFVQENDIESVKSMMEAGLNPNFRVGDMTPLTTALSRYNLEMVRVLVKGGADLNEKDSQGRASVMILVQDAARYISNSDSYKSARQEMGRFIVQQGADVNLKDPSGATPLDFALARGDDDMAALLKELGAKGNEALANVSDWYVKIKQDDFNPDGPATKSLLSRGSPAALDVMLAFSKRTTGQDYEKLQKYLTLTVPQLCLPQRELIPALVELLDNYSLAPHAKKPLLEMGTESIPALIDRLKEHQSGHSHNEVFKVLNEMGASAVPILTNTLADSDRRIAQTAIILLGEIGPNASSALPDLRVLSNAAPEEWIRHAAEMAVRQIETPVLPVSLEEVDEREHENLEE